MLEPKQQAIIDDIYDSIIEGDADAVAEGVQEALAAEIEPGLVLREGMIEAMTEVGRMFEEQECFVPEMLIAARAMKRGMGFLKPHLMASDVQPLGKVVLGTVRGDLHDIGKGLVAIMFEGVGFEVIDMGVDVGPERFVAAVQEHQPNFIGLSALLTTTMGQMRATIDALNAAGVRDQVKVMVGGAPLTEDFAEEIGADIYAPDASAAAKRAKAWLQAQPH